MSAVIYLFDWRYLTTANTADTAIIQKAVFLNPLKISI